MDERNELIAYKKKLYREKEGEFWRFRGSIKGNQNCRIAHLK